MLTNDRPGGKFDAVASDAPPEIVKTMLLISVPTQMDWLRLVGVVIAPFGVTVRMPECEVCAQVPVVFTVYVKGEPTTVVGVPEIVKVFPLAL